MRQKKKTFEGHTKTKYRKPSKFDKKGYDVDENRMRQKRQEVRLGPAQSTIRLVITLDSHQHFLKGAHTPVINSFHQGMGSRLQDAANDPIQNVKQTGWVLN